MPAGRRVERGGVRKRIAYYVSGHGLGHAGRTVAVIQELLAARDDLDIQVRMNAPAAMFASVLGDRVTLAPGPPEPGMAELDPLTIEPGETVRRVREACAGHALRVEREVEALRAAEVRLIAADVPYLAGYAAERLGIPCVAISNFTWDWIYEPLLQDLPDGGELLELIRGGYRRMEALLRLPLGGGAESFREVHDLGFLARRAGRSRAGVQARLGLGPEDHRPRLLTALRGGVAPGALSRAAASAPECLFLSTAPRSGGDPPNVLPTGEYPELSFDDLLQACDVVLSKPGWGILNDCVSQGKALLWTPRHGFREDAVSTAAAPRYLRIGSLSRREYEQGEWGPALRALLSQPPPPETARCDGAARAATLLSRRL